MENGRPVVARDVHGDFLPFSGGASPSPTGDMIIACRGGVSPPVVARDNHLFAGRRRRRPLPPNFYFSVGATSGRPPLFAITVYLRGVEDVAPYRGSFPSAFQIFDFL